MNERGNKEKWMRRRMKTPLINTSEQDVAELLKTPRQRFLYSSNGINVL